MVVLLLLASLLPLVLGAYLSIRETQARLFDDLSQLLQARADQVGRELEAFHASHVRSADRIARFPAVEAFCTADPSQRAAYQGEVRGLLGAYTGGDGPINGAAIVAPDGRIVVSSNTAVEGLDVSFRPHVRAALEGHTVISDLYVSVSEAGDLPSIAYMRPIRDGAGAVRCATLLVVRANALWERLRSVNGLAGPGSFAVLLDQYGIRIGHSSSDELLFRPGGPLPPRLVAQFVEQRRFGARTAQVLGEVRAVDQIFERALAPDPDTGVFRGFAVVNQTWNYGVARRFKAVPWTVFYMSPAANIERPIAEAVRRQLALAAAIIALALAAGYAVAAGIVRRVRGLTTASAAVAAGDLSARVTQGDDELGTLGRSFNAMVERLQAQAQAIEQSRDALEQRVAERTTELSATTARLRAEIEQRQRAQAGIFESQALLQAIVDNSAAAIHVKDLEGHYQLVNRAFLDALGLERHAVLGRTDAEFRAADVAASLRAADEEVARSQSPRIAEESVAAEGGERTFLSVKCPLRNAAGQLRGVVCIATDITQRKQDQLRLQAQLERLGLLDQVTRAIGERQDLQSIYQVTIRSLEERLPADFCCVCRYDANAPHLIVTRVGARSRELALTLAMSEESVVAIDRNGLSQCVRGQLVHEPDIGASAFPFPARLASAGLRSLVMAPLQSEGRVFGVLVVARRTSDAFSSGECEFLRQLSDHVAVAARQAELHGSLQRAYDELQQTQQVVLQQERLRALGQMASGIAHDINNAISPIVLYTESLLEDEPGLSERARGYLRNIACAIDDVAATVLRMREFYRQRPAQLAQAKFAPNRIVGEVVELTRARWSDMPQQRGKVVRLSTLLADEVPAIEGVEGEIREALINLVFNAVDAMPEGGELTLRTRRGRDAAGAPAACIEVCDTGIGMDEATRQRCLEPFFTTKGERGTGLGLAMVYGAVERHGARLDIRSEPGRGTTVTLQFPAPPPETPGVPAPAPHAAARAQPMRILLVDDDPLLLHTLREMLENDGHTVVAANGGAEGIDAFVDAQHAGRPFALVLTDLGMPEVGGRQVAQAVKLASPATPVLMLTGWGHGALGDEEASTDVDEVLAKPPRLVELRRALLRHGACPTVDS